MPYHTLFQNFEVCELKTVENFKSMPNNCSAERLALKISILSTFTTNCFISNGIYQYSLDYKINVKKLSLVETATNMINPWYNGHLLHQ